MLWAAVIPAIASILGAAAKSRNKTTQDNEALDIARANTDLAQREYMRDSPGRRVSSSKSASMLQNFKPTQVQWEGPGSGEQGILPQITGGFNNPNMFDGESRQQAQLAQEEHLRAALMGEDRIPALQPRPTGKVDNILGWGATGGSILSAILGGLGSGQPSKKPILELPNYDPYDPEQYEVNS